MKTIWLDLHWGHTPKILGPHLKILGHAPKINITLDGHYIWAQFNRAQEVAMYNKIMQTK